MSFARKEWTSVYSDKGEKKHRLACRIYSFSIEVNVSKSSFVSNFPYKINIEVGKEYSC